MGPRRAPIACALFAPAVLLARSVPAAAQPAPRGVVELTSAASADDAGAVEVVVLELLGRLGLEVHVQRRARLDPREVLTPRVASGPRPVARAWVELQGTERATVYIADGPWERVLVRHVPLPAGRFDEAAREEVGHLVQASVEALLAGHRIGFERDAVEATLGLAAVLPPPPPHVARTLPSPARATTRGAGGLRFDAAGFYEAQALWGSARFAHGPGFALAGAARAGPVDVGVVLTAAYRFPLQASAPELVARIDQGTFRVLASVESRGPWRFTVRGLLGAGPDLIAIDPRVLPDAGATAAGARAIVVPVVRAGAQLTFRVGAALRVVLGAALELDPIAPRYVVERSTGPDAVLAPAPVRPSLQLGVEAGGG